jgi:glycosyltransferase involved in cell wall biosynthesis
VNIALIGTRGIPARYGGFETFAEKISALMVKAGYHVDIQCDAGSYDQNILNGAELFYSSITKTYNPIRYYWEGLKSGSRNSDILLVATTGGSIFYFLKYFNKKTIITITDGIECKRSKWPIPHRMYLKFSEWLAVRLSDYLIADSQKIREYLESKYPKSKGKVHVIEYGADIVDSFDQKYLDGYGLEPDKYYMLVSRMEPENNIKMIIDGFKISNSENKLLVVGKQTDSKYAREIKAQANDPRIIFTGAIFDDKELKSIRFACRAYIHGHSVGGTNPSLLEAMGSRNICICHDNVFNREVTGNRQLYFSNPEDLAKMIEKVDHTPSDEKETFKSEALSRVKSHYTWDQILNKYIRLFNEIRKTGTLSKNLNI